MDEALDEALDEYEGKALEPRCEDPNLVPEPTVLYRNLLRICDWGGSRCGSVVGAMVSVVREYRYIIGESPHAPP